MRSIVKGAECKVLKDWKKLNAASPQNIHYDNLGKDQRTPMLEALAKEQGGLCAYTMKRIPLIGNTWYAHIEHIFPRSAYPAQSVTWKNILACVPDPKTSCDYGAKLKDDHDPGVAPFVNPTKNGIAAQFRFRENGEVDGLTPAAIESASEKVLNLNHPNLVSDRAGKIKGALERKPTAAEARARARELRRPDGDGLFEPYCEAVAQVLDAYAARLEKRSQRVSGAKRG